MWGEWDVLEKVYNPPPPPVSIMLTKYVAVIAGWPDPKKRLIKEV